MRRIRRGVAQQLVVGFEKAFVDEVVRLNAREGEGELILFVVAGEGGVGQELRGGAFPSAPDLRRREPHGRVIAGEPAVVRREQIAALGFGNMGEVRLPSIGIEHRRAALVEPVDLLLAEQEDAAEHEFGDTIGMSLGIGEGESGAPRSAKHLPPLNVQGARGVFSMSATRSQVVFASRRRVWCALAASALVEVHDAVLFGMEEAALLWDRSRRPGPPCRNTTGLPEGLPLSSK